MTSKELEADHQMMMDIMFTDKYQYVKTSCAWCHCEFRILGRDMRRAGNLCDECYNKAMVDKAMQQELVRRAHQKGIF